MALASTDPRVLMGQAKCFSCLTPKQQFVLQTYLLAVIGLGDTSITGVQSISAASTCFDCFTEGELTAMKRYLLAVLLGLDTSKAGVAAIATLAACDHSCLTPKQAQLLETYLFTITAGTGSDIASIRASAAAAKCFNCLESKQQLQAQVYLLSLIAPGISSDPNSIMAAAKCFFACVPPELHEAFILALVVIVASRSTAPCIAPTAPTQPVAFSALNNILKIKWTQPANPGSVITSYTVSYGTTHGGPYTASKTVGAGTKQAVLNGLTSGTTYYFVVVANSVAGCGSANSPEGSATTAGTPPVCNAGLTFANAWATRVVANGGAAPSQSTINAIANFQCGLITDSLDTQMITWNALVADNLIAAITPQLMPTSGFGVDPWTNHNFVLADLTVNGLKGDGATKWLDTGAGSIGGVTNLTAGITTYNVIADPVGGCDGLDTGLGTDLFSQNPGGNYFCYGINASETVVGNPGWTGYSSGNRTAINAAAIYQANSVTPHNAAGTNNNNNPSGPPNVGFGFAVFGIRNNTGVTTFYAGRLSFFAIHKGLTQAQSALFFARVQALRVALGGGFV